MVLLKLFAAIFPRGSLEVIDWNGRSHQFGDGSQPASCIRLHDPQVEWLFLRSPKLAAGELYMDERLTVERGTLYDFLDLCAINRGALKRHGYLGIHEYLRPFFRSMMTNNPRDSAKSNASHAYDLDERFFRMFLDEDMQYSCAYWEYDENNRPVNTLEEAQFAKKEHLASKLNITRPDLEILDVGCGWGGLAIHLAREHGARVTGITLSKEQLRVAQERAEEAGVSDRTRFILCDYRDAPWTATNAPYDRMISVEMLEHVGVKHNVTYFRELQKRLRKSEGVFVVQWGGRMAPPTAPAPWMKKYIFPGGYTPALSEITAAIEQAVYWINDVECQRLHYADTLQEWNRRFQSRASEVESMYDARFRRMWEFYLTACEVSFRTTSQCVFQLQLTLERDVVPQTRDYQFAWEQARRNRSA